MHPMVKRFAVLVFGISALFLLSSGSIYQGLILWMAGLFAMIWIEKRHIERRVLSILPKLYVCAKPDEYLQWLEDLRKEIILKNLLADKIRVYQASGWLYEMDRPHLEGVPIPSQKLVVKKMKDPAKKMEAWLLSPADRHRALLNELYRIWIENGDVFKGIKPLEVEERIRESEIKISEKEPQKEILVLIGQLICAKWFLAHQFRKEAEMRFSALREVEIFNLMFGEVNYHLGQIESQKKQKEKSAYYYRVALNFADGTALEKMIPQV